MAPPWVRVRARVYGAPPRRSPHPALARRCPCTCPPDANPHPHPIQVAAESSDYSNVPVREGIEEQDRYERTVMNAAGNDGGVTYLQKPGTKGKGKAKAPTGSVAEELGY